jgi:hypothetical protein
MATDVGAHSFAGEQLQLGDRLRACGDDGVGDAVQERAATNRAQVLALGERAAVGGRSTGRAADRDPEVAVAGGGEPPHITGDGDAVLAENHGLGGDGGEAQELR